MFFTLVVLEKTALYTFLSDLDLKKNIVSFYILIINKFFYQNIT